MGVFAICLIGSGLAMDATAIAISNGTLNPNLGIRRKFAIAFCFSSFQALMPIFGYYFSKSFITFIDKIDNLLVFLVLSFLSIKMLISSQSNNGIYFELTTKDIILQGIITSIDALVVGSLFVVFEIYIYHASLIIFIITFIFCFIGVYLGCKLGKLFNSNLEIIGAIILFIVAIKSLFS